MSSVELRVTEKFLQSDYVPDLSLFSGRTGGVDGNSDLRREVIQVGVQLTPGLRGLVGINKNLKLRLPMAEGEWRRWKFWRTVWFLTGGPLLALLLFSLCCGCMGINDRVTGIWALVYFLPEFLAVLEIVAMVVLHYTVMCAMPRFQFVPNDPLDVTVVLPAERAKDVLTYEAAYQAWVTAGSPPPQAPDHDEGWEDKASAGWDQGQN